MRHRIALFTTLLTFVVFFLGNLVVATDAGDACGSDWPKCNGRFIPELTDPLVMIEYTHRLVTGSLGFVILINCWVAWRRKLPGETAVKLLAPLSVVLLFLQAFVGGLNVILKTPPGFTTWDVAISLLLFVSTVLLTVALYRKPVKQWNNALEEERKTYRRLLAPSVLAVGLFYAQSVLGAFFKHSAASDVYLGIELSDRLIHSFALAEFIYAVHGIFSFVIIISAFWIMFYAWRYRILRRLSVLFMALTVLETLIGFSVVLTGAAVISSSAHMLMATITIGVGSVIIGMAGLGRHVPVLENAD